MRVLILHNQVRDGDDPDDRDVLDQVAAVQAALAALGHETATLACDLDLAALKRGLAARPVDVVFNLVESLDGEDRLLPLVPALLSSLGLPYTGAPVEAAFLSTHKLLAKRELAAAGLPTPEVFAAWPPASRSPGQAPAGTGEDRLVGPVILKSVWNHGSQGLEEDLVLSQARVSELTDRLAALSPRLGGDGFAEGYIHGRELNLSLLASPEGVQVLPAAEIRFVDFPPGKPHIVGYAAKWDPAAFEYDHTVRSFDFPADDGPLLAELARIARAAWARFGLRGYARVDFRVDAAGRPLVLEVNANPCLSPDAGFAAAVARAGLRYEQAIARIIADTGARSRTREAAAVLAGAAAE